jgi:hypothetical protein
MSEVRLNVIDAKAVINGRIHGSIADAVVASLSAEPETIAELEVALGRFSKSDHSPFASFRSGEDSRPWDAGVVIVDMAARIIAAESTYSDPTAQGEIEYHNGKEATDVWLPYRIPDDWLIVHSVLEYESTRRSRRNERVKQPRIDIRQVLYGMPLIEFIVNECLAEKERLGCPVPVVTSQTEDYSKLDNEKRNESEGDDTPIQKVHAHWLMTPRSDLGGRCPRDVILEKLNFIDRDLESREFQWSVLREGPPPLPRDSHAYLNGGFGTHEYVVYYDFVRYLLGRCWDRISEYRFPNIDAPEKTPERDELQENLPSKVDQVDFLGKWLHEIGEAWLNSPCEELSGSIPVAIIESERRRIPLLTSGKEDLFDDCPLCQMIAEDAGELFGPGFWHYDGSHIDPLFEFSTYLTREEWEAEERKWQEYNEEFDRRWARDHPSSQAAGSDPTDDDNPY